MKKEWWKKFFETCGAFALKGVDCGSDFSPEGQEKVGPLVEDLYQAFKSRLIDEGLSKTTEPEPANHYGGGLVNFPLPKRVKKVMEAWRDAIEFGRSFDVSSEEFQDVMQALEEVVEIMSAPWNPDKVHPYALVDAMGLWLKKWGFEEGIE